MAIVPLNDRLKGGLERIMRAVFGPRIDYFTSYSAVVKSQAADGTLELQFDNPKMPGGATGGVQGIPVDTGIPGVSFTIQIGARVQVVFVEGDPSKARVTEWEKADVISVTHSGTTIKLGAGATHPLIFGDDFSSSSGAFGTLVKAIADAIAAIPANAPAGGTAAGAAITTALGNYQTAVASKLSSTVKTV